MVRRIERDRTRFRQIVGKNIRKDLRKYITHTEMIGKKGRGIVSIPMPQIDLPRFRFGRKDTGGVGQGEGNVGDPIGTDPDDTGNGRAGTGPGEHILEVDITLEELVKIMQEELELPRIQPRGKRLIPTGANRYSSIARAGPDSLRHFKRTFKEALKRELASGNYDPENPVIVPIREDERFRASKIIMRPESNAVIFFMMDVSGSMGEAQKEIVRLTTFWIDLWIRANYKNTENRYLIHDDRAKQVDENSFYRTRESGGTKISTIFELCLGIIGSDFPPQDWNIYGFYFGDGDNWTEDNERCFGFLSVLFPLLNLLGYGQVAGTFGTGTFLENVNAKFSKVQNFIATEIRSRGGDDDGNGGIWETIKVFLGKGK